MLLNSKFPNFDPELYLEPEGLPEVDKITWTPDKNVINSALLKYGFTISFPAVYYSAPPELLALTKPHSVTFKDELIKKYEVYKDEDGITSIKIFTEDHHPFRVTLSEQGIVGPMEMLNIYATIESNLDLPIDTCYKNDVINSLIGYRSDEQSSRRLPKTVDYNPSESSTD